MAMLLLAFFLLVPMLLKQVTQLVQQLPNMLAEAQAMLTQLPEKYPRYISHDLIDELLFGLRTRLVSLGQAFISNTLSSLIGLLTLVVYLVLVPLLVFFFLKDKEKIINWFIGFLPDAARKPDNAQKHTILRMRRRWRRCAIAVR